MPAFRPSRISSPGILAKVSPDRLLTFLEPMRDYLKSQRVAWPSAGDDQIDYEMLGRLLHFPKEGFPPEMVVRLVLVDEMSTDAQMDRLLEATARRRIGLALGGDNSPADVAIQVWLQVPQLLEELHAENHTIAQKNFRGFVGSDARSREFPEVAEQTLQALQRDLDDTFEEYERGRGCRVFIFDRGRKVWIMVRRGATFKREESMKDGGWPGVQFYRPLMPIFDSGRAKSGGFGR
jgi:hypothetical protein